MDGDVNYLAPNLTSASISFDLVSGLRITSFAPACTNRATSSGIALPVIPDERMDTYIRKEASKQKKLFLTEDITGVTELIPKNR